jgi:hypothetical protein
MIPQLARLNPQQLRVIARTSVMGYKHSDVRLDQIGRDLSVQYVLENSLRESGDHMRLTAQLIQVKDQTHLWSQDYDYPVKDTLIIEDDVAKAVAHEVQLRLSSQQQADLSESRPVNPEAFDAYLQGYYFFTKIRTRRRSISNAQLNLILPTRWRGSGCRGYATGRPTQALFPLRRVAGLPGKQLSEQHMDAAMV